MENGNSAVFPIYNIDFIVFQHNVALRNMKKSVVELLKKSLWNKSDKIHQIPKIEQFCCHVYQDEENMLH